MKKTLTVNLGGTVFHIDEDAYKLLDEYINNLKLHFRKQEGAQEIVADIENRISELFSEKIGNGSQVISINYVEEVIERMGRPEELAGTDKESGSENKSYSSNYSTNTGREYTYSRRRLYRNPDDRILGGVVSGLGAYLGWDVTLLRLLLIVIMIAGVGTLIPIYIICWLVIPEARTAAEKLNMRGEEVTVENIGKTVKDGFEKMSNEVNDYFKSDKPRTFLQQLGDVFVKVFGFILKACLVILAIVCAPVLFVLAIVFVALLIAIISVAIGGGAVLYSLLPSVDWGMISGEPIVSLATSISGILIVGVPLAALIFSILRQIFNWEPMATGLKWALIILWFVGVVIFLLGLSEMNWQLPYFGVYV